MGLIEAFKQLPKQGERIYFPLSLSVVAGYYGTDDGKPKSTIPRKGGEIDGVRNRSSHSGRASHDQFGKKGNERR